ncbi:hypothetical protein EHQ64_05300 [Leptospira sarikeiensis]|uniref:Glycosyltransferase RgtA/B/C/D-like domain-containing protein n=2 Tax=Leptospira sarikeiensis TaxID=2484943 RepID=A0A4R9KAM5_9LEPT|nr:hypothetical protein EHQ64_05300 [Leptospira sarikeiensis]
MASLVNLLFFLSLFLNAYFISVILHKKGLQQPLGRNLVSLTLSILSVGSIALLLVSFESYTIWSTVILQFLLTAGLIGYLFFGKTKLLFNPLQGTGKRQNLFVSICLTVLILSAGVMYSLYPIEYIKGDRDHGVYIVFGSHIQKTGGLNFDDPRYQELIKIFGTNLIQGYPAIHADQSPQDPNAPIGSLSPRFYPLYPTFIALALDLFSIDAIFRVNTVFGILSLLFIYLIVKRMIGPIGALTAVFFCAFNPAQLWNVRATLSETLGQLLILFSCYLALYFFRKKKGWMFFAGCILGLSSFNRIDSLIYFPAIAIFAIYLSIFREKYLWKGIDLLIGFTVISILGILYGYINSKPYILDLWRSKQLYKLTLLCVFSSLALLAFVSVSNTTKGRSFIESIRNFIYKHKSLFRIFVFGSLFCLIAFSYSVQPVISAAESANDFAYFKRNGFLFFLLYVPIILVLFGIGGYDLLLFRKKYSGAIIFILLGSLLSFVYFYDPSIYPDHFWVSRRWILFPIPYACIMGVVGLFSLPIKKQFLKLIIIVVIFTGYVYHLYNRDRLILFERMLSGYSEEFQRLATALPTDKAIYFTKKQDLASPLRYLIGRETYLIQRTKPFLQEANKLIQSGWNVYLIDEDFSLEDENVSVEKIDEIRLEGNFPLDTVNRYPDTLLYRGTFSSIYKLKANDRVSLNKEKSSDIDTSKFSYLLRTVKSERKNQPPTFEEVRAYDHYLGSVPKGKFRVEFEGESLTLAKFSITANQSSSMIRQESPGDGNDKRMIIEFNVEDPTTDDVQIRIHTRRDQQAIIKSIQIRRI